MSSRQVVQISSSKSSLDRMARSLLLIIGLICSGGLLAGADSSHALSGAAWIGLLPLFITIRYASPRIALFYGALWGLCLYLFSVATGDGAVSATVRSMGFLAAVPAIYAYLGARLTRRVGYAPLVLAVGWIIVELALEPLALRQGLLAGTQVDGGVVRLVGGILGYVFVAFLIAFVNAQILSLVDGLRVSLANFVSVFEVSPYRCGCITQPRKTCYSA
jgi:apolipoprotein N-acyltransferase